MIASLGMQEICLGHQATAAQTVPNIVIQFHVKLETEITGLKYTIIDEGAYNIRHMSKSITKNVSWTRSRGHSNCSMMMHAINHLSIELSHCISIIVMKNLNINVEILRLGSFCMLYHNFGFPKDGFE